MAKVRSNNGGGDPNKVNTKDYSKVYNQDQQRSMSNQFKGDKRGMAAAIKEDIGNTNLKKYRYGTQGHQEQVKQSMANESRRTAENKAGTGTTPSNTAGRSAYIERTSTDATKLDKYTKTDNPTNSKTTVKKYTIKK